MKKFFSLALVVGMLGFFGAGCAGVRTGQDTYVAHATAFHFFGLKLPGDSLEMAEAQVPANAKNKQTVAAAPSDWTSFWGVLSNIMGFNSAMIGGELQ